MPTPKLSKLNAIANKKVVTNSMAVPPSLFLPVLYGKTIKEVPCCPLAARLTIGAEACRPPADFYFFDETAALYAAQSSPPIDTVLFLKGAALPQGIDIILDRAAAACDTLCQAVADRLPKSKDILR